MLFHSDLERLRQVRDAVPAAMYITDLSESGGFLFTSAMLDQLLGYAPLELESRKRPESLYETEDGRDAWVHSLKDDEPFQKEIRFRRKDGTLVPVLDTARRVSLEGRPVAIGTLHDRTTETEARLLRDQFQQILDHEWQTLGVHIVNCDGKVEWMNNWGRQLLSDSETTASDLAGWIQSGPAAALLSATDTMSFEGANDRILQKLNLDGSSEEALRKLTKKKHRTFVVPPNLPINSRQDAKSVAVNIDDHPVEDVRNDVGLSKMITVVRKESVQESIKSRLLHVGARNPLLSRAQVCSFIKVLRSAARLLDPDIPDGDENDFVFIWANDAFEKELIQQNRIDKRQPNDKRGRYYGMSESELYPEPEFCVAFAKADKRVLGLESKELDERIEDHPTDAKPSRNTASVQVLKAPCFLHPEDFPKQVSSEDLPDLTRPHGVSGFFWYVSNTAVTDQLSLLFQPWSLLDDLEHPAATKDEDGRFTYANAAFCTDNGKRLDEVIGRTDRDLFDVELAERYEQDDESVRESGEQIFQREPHGTPDNPDRIVIVVKIPVRLGSTGDSRTGIHFIYWPDDSDPDLPSQDRNETSEAIEDQSGIDFRLRQLKYRGVLYQLDWRKKYSGSGYHHASVILLDQMIQNPQTEFDAQDLLRIIRDADASDSDDVSNHIRHARDMLKDMRPVSDDDETVILEIARGPNYRIIERDAEIQ